MTTDYQRLAGLFKGLAHPTRLQILDLLRDGELCVCHIEAALAKRQAYISQQLMALREAGLVDSRRDGLQVYYWLADEQVVELLNAALGEPRPVGCRAIAGCSCPACSEVKLKSIQ